jgi:PQQ-like domain/Lecithin:cholesterol acyltransferase
MNFHLIQRVSFLLLILAISPALAEAEEFGLLNAAAPEIQQKLEATSPGFLDAQRKSVKINYPLFIFVPGIIGSKLERVAPAPSKTLWGSYDFSTPDLSIKDGDDTNVKASILLDYKFLNLQDVDAYASGLKEIRDAQLGVELLDYFPYDWRQDNGRTAEKLNDWLCDPRRQAAMKDREIRFIAHSMGGLVVKEWFRHYGGQPQCRSAGSETRVPQPLKIKEVIFLGTPNFGAPKAIKTLASGFTLAAKSFAGPLGLISTLLDKATVAKALNEYGTMFPSAYELLPIYHEHAPDCMDAYHIAGDEWPPHIADIGGTTDRFSIFKASAWETFDWPESKPPSLSREKFYEFLDKTLLQARNFLCRLAQYKFPPGVKVTYFASNSKKTETSFEIKKTGNFIWGYKWVLEDVARPPWTEGDGTVPMFVGRNALAVGFTQLEDSNATERHECDNEHSDLLNCKALGTYIRDLIATAKREQADAATAYLQSHPEEKHGVVETLASANVYLDCGLTATDIRQSASYSGCPLNDEIREQKGITAATLLAQAKDAPASAGKPAQLEVVASMNGLDASARVDAAEAAGIASIETGSVNGGRNLLVALAGPAASPDKAQTIRAGDNVYVNSPISNKVIAVNTKGDPSVEWTRVATAQSPEVIPVMCCETSRGGGLAYDDGKVLKFDADSTTLVALDAKTGKEVWKATPGDPKRGEAGDTAPYIVGDKVFVGVSGAEFGVRGHVTAYNLKTGKQLWRSYSVGPDDEILFDPKRTLAEGKPVGKDSSLKTWTGDQWKIGSGPQSSELVFDPELKLMYFVVGGAPAFQPETGQIQERLPTIFARAIDTGEARWIYRLQDVDAASSELKAKLALAERTIDGKPRKVLEYSDQLGNFLVIDREQGELLGQSKTNPPAPKN